MVSIIFFFKRLNFGETGYAIDVFFFFIYSNSQIHCFGWNFEMRNGLRLTSVTSVKFWNNLPTHICGCVSFQLLQENHTKRKLYWLDKKYAGPLLDSEFSINFWFSSFWSLIFQLFHVINLNSYNDVNY